MKYIIPLLSAIALAITKPVQSVPLEATRLPQQSGHLPSLHELQEGNVILAQDINEDKSESIVVAGKRLLLDRQTPYEKDTEEDYSTSPAVSSTDDDQDLHPKTQSEPEADQSTDTYGSQDSFAAPPSHGHPEYFPFDCSTGLSYINDEDGTEVYLSGQEVCSKLGIIDEDRSDAGQESEVNEMAQEGDALYQETKRQLGVLHIIPQEDALPLPTAQPSSPEQHSAGPAEVVPSTPASGAAQEVAHVVAGDVHIGKLEDSDPAAFIPIEAVHPTEDIPAGLDDPVDPSHLVPMIDPVTSAADADSPRPVGQRQGIVTTIVNGVKNIFSGGSSDSGVLHLIPQQDDSGSPAKSHVDEVSLPPADQLTNPSPAGIDIPAVGDDQPSPNDIIQDVSVQIGSDDDGTTAAGDAPNEAIGQIGTSQTGIVSDNQGVQDNLPGQVESLSADLNLGQQTSPSPASPSEIQVAPTSTGPALPPPVQPPAPPAESSPQQAASSPAPVSEPENTPAPSAPSSSEPDPAPATSAPPPAQSAPTEAASQSSPPEPSSSSQAASSSPDASPTTAPPAAATCVEGYDAEGVYQACDYNGENPGAYLGDGTPTSVSTAVEPGPTCMEGYDAEGVYQACDYQGENPGAYLGEGGQNQDGDSVLPADGIVGQLPVSAVPCKLHAGSLIDINALVNLGELVDLCIWAGVFVPEGYTPCPHDLQHYIPVHATTDGVTEAQKRSPQIDFVDGDEADEPIEVASPEPGDPAQEPLNSTPQESAVDLPEAGHSGSSPAESMDSATSPIEPGSSADQQSGRELIRLCVTGGAL